MHDFKPHPAYVEEYQEQLRRQGDHRTAIDQVFTTSELLHHILLHLPPNMLLKCQAVCKHFKDSYQGSTPLKLKTFEQVNRIAAIPHEDDETYEFNPLLFRSFYDIDFIKQLHGAPGIKTLYLDIGAEHGPRLLIEFDQVNWRRSYTGSWTRLHMTDKVFPATLCVQVQREKAFDTTSCGDEYSERKMTGRVRFDGGTIGDAITLAQDLNGILVDNFGKIPSRTSHLKRALSLDNAGDKISSGELVASCEVLTTYQKRPLN